MNNSAFDDHIKKQFGSYNPDVPPHIWEKIVADKDRKKPAGFWLNFSNNKILYVVAATLLIAAVTFLINKQLSSSNITPHTTVSQNNEPGLDSHSMNTPTTEKDQSTTNKTTITNNSSGKNNTEAADTKAGNHPLVLNTHKKSNIKITGAGASGINKQTEASIVSNETGIAGRSASRKTKGRAGMQIKAPQTTNTDEFEPGEDVVDAINNPEELYLHRLDIQAALLHSEKKSLSINKPQRPDLNIPCPESERNAAGNKRYFEIYGGPDYAFRSIRDTANSNYLQKRKESTSFSSAFSVGLRYTKVFGNGIGFKTGLNYSQINEKFKYAEGNIIQVIYITNGSGDTTGSYISTGTRYKTTFNKYKTLDIPLTLGYEMGNGRWHANINAGAIINIYSWQKGDVLDTAYKPVTITTGKSNSPYQFRSNIGVGFLAAVSVYYKISDKLHLMAEPYFRYNFSPASKAALTLKEKYSTAGIRLGIRLDF